ncbi:ethanolamine ammonia-lyase subunit EutC [Vibrio sp. dsl-7]|uniref:Ethanolamine ammonia-lyase small subunit n=1 Tax=Vibrio chanodichtyis TaxID=3027932 RepID=A0ABT5V1U9_9VIBR|nr:ethanolamine ammonia-lyase subunit EutC [Vibrio chanodichtyis]MDE1515418.1 ethanolamine ammonia-lyase subunit EutC [Vibrio chanodichtyis]
MSVIPISALIHQDPWHKLRQFTQARIGIGRVGTSIPTEELLRFQLSHAQAIDAVHVPLDEQQLLAQLAEKTALIPYLPAFSLHSQANDRLTYLQRPDLGRQLCQSSIEQLKTHSDATVAPYDLAIVIADGLSSYAISHHAAPFIDALIMQLNLDQQHEWNIAPLSIVHQGRVAVGDDVGEAINAREVLVLIGERPGLSSPDSLGLYLTWHPQRGTEDSLRNCISNVRPQGLPYQAAAMKCFYLLAESRRLKLTGVELKDRSDDMILEHQQTKVFSLTSTS